MSALAQGVSSKMLHLQRDEMNFLEALIELRHGKTIYHWIRPRAWKGQRAAFMMDFAGIRGKNLVFVPSSIPYPPSYFPPISDLLADWEIIDPETVNSGG